MENEWIRKSALQLATRLNMYIGKEGLDFVKMTLGMEVMIINITKLIAVYLLAAILGVVPQTATLHFAYILVKRYSFGLHALNSTVCTIVSCTLFVAVPWVLHAVGLGIGNVAVAVVFAPLLLCLYKYAPADTKARPLVGEKLRAKLKRNTMICALILMGIALLVTSREIKLLLTLGVTFQCVSLLPIIYKTLKRSEKNYEVYESK